MCIIYADIPDNRVKHQKELFQQINYIWEANTRDWINLLKQQPKSA